MEEQSGGEIAPDARRRRLLSSSDAPGRERDHLSALPDDVLVLILVRLRTAAAARTSVLSRRWRRVWSLLPDLCFPYARDPRLVRDALASHQAALRSVSIGTLSAAPESVADLLPVAARRLSGRLAFHNVVPWEDVTSGKLRGSFDLPPIFEHVTALSLDLGYLGLSVPRAGAFTRLTEISLICVWFQDKCGLGDAVSSSRCPCLQKLVIRDARGLEDLSINSESLQLMELRAVVDLRQLTVVAPVLKDLSVVYCYFHNLLLRRPVTNISAPQLEVLHWQDTFDPSTVQLGKMEHLQSLEICFTACGPESYIMNPSCLSLLSRFKVVERLILRLLFDLDFSIGAYCLMEDMSTLPCIKFLHLIVTASGHAFGASSFHVLRMCTGITRLVLLLTPTHLKAQAACSSGCICHLPPIWKTEKLSLDHLEEVEIRQFSGSEHEVSLVKRLFKWAPVLKKMTVTFDPLVDESMVEESWQMLQSHSGPEICIKFYMYQDFIEVLYAPKAKAISA